MPDWPKINLTLPLNLLVWPLLMRKSSLAAWIIVALLVGGSLLATGGSGEPDNPRVVKIVSSLPRTGSAKAQTDTIVNGIRIALEEADGKCGEFDVVFGDWDDATAAAGQWTAEAETANARRAVRDPDVMVYIGTYNSGAAKISMPILNRAHLLMVSPANTWPGLTKPGKGDPGEPEIYRPTGKINYVRVVPADDLQGPLSARLGQGAGRPPGVRARRQPGLRQGHRQAVHRRPARIWASKCLGRESIDDKAQEFKALMTTIKGLQPDLIYFGGTTQTKGGQIAKDMVAAGLDV